MSVLVWDGKTLAADRQISYNGASVVSGKLFAHNDMLIGFTGDASRAMAVLDWLRNGAEPDKFPATTDNDGSLALTTLVVHRDGRVHQFERTPYPVDLSGNTRYCLGAGADFAYGALSMGATAEQAVLAASAYSIYCGQGVDTLAFDGELIVQRTKI